MTAAQWPVRPAPRRLARLTLLLALAGSWTACSSEKPPAAASHDSSVNAIVPPEPGVLRLAGSGTVVPLARALVKGYQAANPNDSLRIVVEESLGSGGGARAAMDGAVDLGLMARPVKEAERRQGLHEVRFARDAVIIAANHLVRRQSITSDELRELYQGDRRTLGNDPAVLLLRDRAETANDVLEKVVPGLTEHREAAYGNGHRRVLFHDEAMIGSLVSTSYAVGVASLGVIVTTKAPLHALGIDNQEATVEALMNNTWPITRPVSFAGLSDRLERGGNFIRFATSPAGAAIIRQCGFRPETL